MKKLTLFLIIAIFASSLVFSTSLKECPRTATKESIPCIVATSYLPSLPCGNYNYSIINQNNISIENGTWQQTVTSCQFTFTYNTPDIYFWNSSIESGVITVERENNMIAIILVFILLISYFAILGLINNATQLKFLCFSLSILELILMVAIIYVAEGSGDYLVLLSVNFYAILIIGFGLGIMTFFIKSADNLNMMSDESDLKLKEEGKWNNNKW